MKSQPKIARPHRGDPSLGGCVVASRSQCAGIASLGAPRSRLKSGSPDGHLIPFRTLTPVWGTCIVNSQDLGQLTQIGPRGLPRELTIGWRARDRAASLASPTTWVGVNGRFKHPELNMMCQQPPRGSLTAVNVHTGGVCVACAARHHRQTCRPTSRRPAVRAREGRLSRRAVGCSSARPTTAASAPSTRRQARNCGPKSFRLRRTRSR